MIKGDIIELGSGSFMKMTCKSQLLLTILGTFDWANRGKNLRKNMSFTNRGNQYPKLILSLTMFSKEDGVFHFLLVIAYLKLCFSLTNHIVNK